MVRVETRKYEASHGHTPRQSREYRVSPWAFRVDGQTDILWITASYRDAVKQAKAQAQWSVEVLP